MKIYTEEQVRNLLEKMCLATEKNNLGVAANFRHRAIEINKLINSQTPIELPSDEEIKQSSLEWFLPANKHEIIFDLGWMKIFEAGAKYVINKIQGGNK